MLTENPTIQTKTCVTLDGGRTSVAQVAAAAKINLGVCLSDDPAVLNRVAASAKFVDQAVARGDIIYGVTTGFGGMADTCVPASLAAASQDNLLSFLASGAGPAIDRRHVRAAILLRANVLLQGCSGVRLEIIERLVRFLNADAIPVVRELGSIGASGDLVPLSTIGRAITGKTGFVNVQLGNRTVDGKTALSELGLEPINLLPKEGLAIVNGTSFSSAIAANAVYETRNLMGLAIGTQSLMLRALLVHENPFEEFVHQCKPHPGQVWVARVTKRWLAEGREHSNGKPVQVQDRYSLRCLPQYMGPIVEGIARINQVVETEMNSVSDNPLIHPESGEFYQSGNFLGQYIGVAMDDLRRHIGLMAKHLDVQIASLVTPEFSGGLPASLRGNEEVTYNMGLKGLQITGNSIMPMLTYFGNPVVEHFPTHAEQFNQNINGLSWGSANLAWNSVKLFQQYLSVALIFAVQALDIRAKTSFGHYDGRVMLGTLAQPLYAAVCDVLKSAPGKDSPLLFNDTDRWLEQDIESLTQDIGSEGPTVDAVQPLLDSFKTTFLSTPP
jgi:phenylalanine ammonia-lyase